MLRRKGLWALVLLVTVGMIVAGQAISQERRGRESRGEPDPERMREMRERFRQRRAENMMETLGVNKEEWKILSPRIEKVETALRDSGGGGMRWWMMGRRGRRRFDPRQGAPAREQRDVQKKTESLRTLLEKEKASPAEIKSAMMDLRKAREKSRQDLATARKSLREVVTLRQEGQLLLMGLLD